MDLVGVAEFTEVVGRAATAGSAVCAVAGPTAGGLTTTLCLGVGIGFYIAEFFRTTTMGQGVSHHDHERELQERWNREREEEKDRERRRQKAERRRLEEQERQMRAEAERLRAQAQALQRKRDQEERERKQREEELRNYPVPEWLNAHMMSGMINIGIVGSSGVGKSLLNNRLRGLGCRADCNTDPSLWAETGETETTLRPRPFAAPGHANTHIWDLPGVGTERFPRETYFRDVGLRHFHALIIVCRNRFAEGELALRDECQRLGLPVFFVRTFMDKAVENEGQDYGLSAETTSAKVRVYLREQAGVTDPFLLALRADPDKIFVHELDRLQQAIAGVVVRFCAGRGGA